MREEEREFSKFIGEKIKASRARLELTQEEAAEKAGLSAMHLGRLERGERSMKLYTFLKLGKVLPFYDLNFTQQESSTTVSQSSGT